MHIKMAVKCMKALCMIQKYTMQSCGELRNTTGVVVFTTNVHVQDYASLSGCISRDASGLKCC